MEANKKKNLTTILSIISAAIIVVAIAFISRNNRKHSAYTVAFYNVPQEFCDQITFLLKKRYVGSIAYVNYDEEFIPSRKELRNVDLVFTWGGKREKELEKFAREFPVEKISALPEQTRLNIKQKGKFYYVPILLDCFNVHTLTGTDKIYYLPIPANQEELFDYLNLTKSYVDIPLFVNASDDRTLLAFFGAQAEAICGGNAYINLIEEIERNPDLYKIQDYVIGQTFDGTTMTVASLMDYIRKLKADGYLTDESFLLPIEEEEKLLAKKKIYADAKMLSTFTELDDSVFGRYNTTPYPQEEELRDHCLIAPSIVMMQVSKRDISASIAEFLLSDGAQNLLTQTTYLTPVTQSALPYDEAADAVRYLSLVSPKGPQPDLYTACFLKASEAAHFASQLRYELSR